MKFNAIIFDIDNVLVNTQSSYTDCIRETVKIYCSKYLTPKKFPALSRLDVEHFKSLGGFNDDWDTCYGLLLYLNASAKKTIKTWPLGIKGAEKIFGKNKKVSLKKN